MVKILRLEQRRGCADDAVMGGLDRYLQQATDESGLRKTSPILKAIDSLPSGGYRGLPAPARERWLTRALAAIEETKRLPSPRPRPASPGPTGSRPNANVEAPVTVLKGIKEGLATKFEKLGVTTVRDLLYLLPSRHNDYANLRKINELTPGEDETVRVRVWSAHEAKLGPRRGTEATVGDDSGMMRVVWFNNPWIAKQLRTNSEIVLSGRVHLYKGRPTFDNPEWEVWDNTEEPTHTGRLVPVYPLTDGLGARTVRRAARQALDTYADSLTDSLPASLRQRLGLLEIRTAIRQAHYPDRQEDVQQARRRIAFDELLPLQVSVLLRRREWKLTGAVAAMVLPEPAAAGFRASLPFSLTSAQERALDSLLDDMGLDRPMSRLLQGDVGSGKTVVAAFGLLASAVSGHQSVLMAPTEILAEQHFRTLASLYGAREGGSVREATPDYLSRPLRIALLTGSTRSANRSEVYQGIESGEIDIVIGTHAVIQGAVSFARLGLAIVDEQHRFGVMQRAALRDKSGQSAHMLVMSATPIPRSLYLTLYGDLDVSVIDEMPPGRKPVETHWWPPERREDAYDFMRREVERGRQAFVICPLVEESDSLQSKAAVQEYDALRTEVFPDLAIDLVHGRMPGREKDAAMARFRSGESQILVSTAVIEVGIDIPNATVMLIDGADRFGLAQLHQFRGRVGRGGEQSYCLLLAESPSPDAQERLRLMQRTNDGFALAEADLRMRGPGEFFGVRQSGLPNFRVADLLDTRLIELARHEAEHIIAEDPDLQSPSHAALKTQVDRLFQEVTGEVH
jgi:ATP-dependent DNA helicase RecG